MLIKCDAKVCTKCKKEKPLEEFYNNRTHKSGKTFWCKECTNYQNNTIQKETKARWAAKAHQKRRQTNTELYLWKMAKGRAKKKGLTFTINVSDITIPPTCPILGVPLVRNTKGKSKYFPSIDRKDSTLGYTPENIWIISTIANHMKWDSTKEELIAFCKGILLLEGGP